MQERIEGKMKDDTFTVTDEHIKLLRRAYVGWEDCEYGAPSIDRKRPYGNSGVAGDIAEILGWDWDDSLTDEQVDRARELHKETQTALQIFLITGEMKTGTYAKTDKYDYRSWNRIP